MKTLTATALLMLISVALIACSEQTTSANTDETPEVLSANATVEAKVDGMVCGVVCAPEVSASAKTIDGVMDVNADYKTGQVTLTLKDDADADAVIEAFKKDIPALHEGKKYKVISIEHKPAKKAAGCDKGCCDATPA